MVNKAVEDTAPVATKRCTYLGLPGAIDLVAGAERRQPGFAINEQFFAILPAAQAQIVGSFKLHTQIHAAGFSETCVGWRSQLIQLHDGATISRLNGFGKIGMSNFTVGWLTKQKTNNQ